MQEVVSDALHTYQVLVTKQPKAFGGYVVGFLDGLCMAAFPESDEAVRSVKCEDGRSLFFRQGGCLTVNFDSCTRQVHQGVCACLCVSGGGGCVQACVRACVLACMHVCCMCACMNVKAVHTQPPSTSSSTFRPAALLLRWSCTVVSLLKEVDWPPELLAHELCEEMAMQLVEHPLPPPVVGADALPVMAEEAGEESLVVEPRVMGYGGGNSCLQVAVTSRHSHSEISHGSCTLPSAMEEHTRSVLLFRGPRLKVGIDVGEVGGKAKEYGSHGGKQEGKGQTQWSGRFMC